MKKLLLILLSVPLLFSCGEKKETNNKEFTKNLEHFKNPVNDINTYFIDSSLENL